MKATAVVVLLVAVVVAVLSLAGTIENTINAGIADARASVASAQAARAWAEMKCLLSAPPASRLSREPP